MSERTQAARPRGRPRSKSNENPSAKALDKGLLVLQRLSMSDGLSLNDLSLDLDMPQATVHRLLGTLEHHGFVVQSKTDARWSIGIEAFRVGSAFPRAAKLVDLARPVLRELFNQSGETANLGILDRNEIVFIAQHETDHAIRAFFRPGSRSSWHASGIGKALVAFLDVRLKSALLDQAPFERFTDSTLVSAKEIDDQCRKVREQGYALDDEERYEGMRCIAAPVFNARGEVQAGISISGPVARVRLNEVERLSRFTRQAAFELSKDLGAPDAILERLSQNRAE